MFPNPFQTSRNMDPPFVECGLVSYLNDLFPRKAIPTPLVSVSVFASVVHAVAQVEITQVYTNQENNPIETFYYFPLDSNGAVTHFHAEIEGRKIKGIVKSDDEAKAVYNKAVENNQSAFLGEQNKPDIFKIRIGYLKPGTQVKIVIGYVTEVKNEKGSSKMRFFLPTTVAPRYIPPTENDPKGKDLANMNFSSNSPAQMSIQVNIVLQGGIKSVESPSHSIVVTEKGPVPEKSNWSRSIVQLKGMTTDMDRDFVLVFTPEENQKPKIYAETVEKEGKKSMAAMAYLIPSFTLDDQKTELIFLLDQSGSMGGNSINLAKQALILFLHSLPVDCYFNVVGFGSRFSSLFPNSVKYNDINLQSALFHAQALAADMGGTEIFTPLQHIYSLPNIPGYLRQIFVLTDGEVSNTEQVLGLTKINAHRIRLFSLGIGNAASHHLVEGLASSGGGTSVFVTNNEPFESKVLQQLKNAVEPSLTDIHVEWDGLPTPTKEIVSEKPVETAVNTEKTLFGYRKPIGEHPIPSEIKPQEELPYKQAPQKIPPIFDGSQMLLFGIFEDKLPTGVTITADSPDGPLSIKIPLSDENDVGPTGMLHNLAAIKIVKEMEMDMTALEILRVDYLTRGRRMTTESLKSEIIKLACSQGIASRFTSFVAVDEENKETSENWRRMQTRNVPSQIPQGYGHISNFRGIQNYRVFPNTTLFGSTSGTQSSLFGQSAQVQSAQMQQPQQLSQTFGSGSVFGGSQSSGPVPFGGGLSSGPGIFGGGLSSGPVPFGGPQSSGPVFGGAQFGPQPTAFGSQPAAFGSQPTAFGSQPAVFGSQPTAFGSQTAVFGSQPTAFGSQTAVFGSQPTAFGSEATTFSFGSPLPNFEITMGVAPSLKESPSSTFGPVLPQPPKFVKSNTMSDSCGFSGNARLGEINDSATPLSNVSGGFSFNSTPFHSPFQAIDPRLEAQSCSTFNIGNTNPSAAPFTFGLKVTETEKQEDPLHKLISVQSFEGVFSLNEILASVVGKDLTLIKRESTENGWDEKGWATAIAIVFLSEKLAERKEAWELVYKKARKWLEKHHTSHLESMLAAASKLIS